MAWWGGVKAEVKYFGSPGEPISRLADRDVYISHNGDEALMV